MVDEDFSSLKNAIEEMESKIGSQQNALKALELKVKTEQMDAEDRIVKEMIDESSKQYEDVKKLVETKIASSLTSLKNELGDSFADKFDAFKKEILAEMQDMIVKPVETKCEAETPHKDIVSSECNESNGLDNLTSLEQKLLEKNKELEQKIQQLTESNEKLRNDLKQLLNTTKDHAACIETMKNTQANADRINKESQQLKRRSSKNASTESSSKFVWKIKEFDKVLENLGSGVDGFESEYFNLKGYESRMMAQLKRHEDHISIYLAFVYDNNSDKTERPIYYHRRSFIIIDQSDNPIKKDIIRICEPSFGRNIAEQWMTNYWGSLKFVSLSLLTKDDTYVRNGTILIHIIIEPLTKIYQNILFKDGVLFWRMENYRNQKQDEISGVSQGIKSHSFYMTPHGYRTQFEICLNGYGEENKGKYISAFLWFRRGQWDDFLPRALHHKVKIMILDQSDGEDKEHLSYIYKYHQIFNRSYSKLVLQSAIENSVYLKDNALLIKISIMPIKSNELSDDPLGKELED